MKNLFFTIYLIFFASLGWTQGWRSGEMEVRILPSGPEDVARFLDMKLNYDVVSFKVPVFRAYLTGEELGRVIRENIPYEIIIPDLNNHFKDFWTNQQEIINYYTYEQIIAIADSLVQAYPSICQKVIWGTSLGGRQLAALRISKNISLEEPEPEIMFDGGIHGDEIGGSQNIIMFARDLCKGYGSNEIITGLINTREIWLYLMVNPDGRVSMSRYNNNGVDLNRDCGYMWNGEGSSTGAFSQVETRAWRDCLIDNQFVVYTNYHSGTEIISYPWSYRPDQCRDYTQINQLAGVYSQTSGYPDLEYGQGFNVMYAINGSTKDFQYGSLGNIGWSIEISYEKQPPASQIMTYYNYNKPAMLEMIRRCGWGISGIVSDSLTGEPIRAAVWINNYYPVSNDPVVGDFHKFILPGTYSVTVTADGYKTKTISGIEVAAQGFSTVNFQLVQDQVWWAAKVLSCRIPGNNFDDEGYTPGVLGRPDTLPYALGKNGWVVVDMADTVFNGQGNDFRVIQSGSTNKSFTVSGSNYKDGPFTIIGTGTGSKSFDLGAAGLSKVRYLYIKDNGTGSPSGIGAGYNLDAVEMLTPPLIVKFSASDSYFCAGQSISFTDQSTGNPITWSWTFPGGSPGTSTQQNPQDIQYFLPGIYPVSLTISNGVTSSGRTKNGYIHVFPLPLVNLGHDTVVCAGVTMTLDAGNPDNEYLWSTGETSQIIAIDSSGVGYAAHDYWVMVTLANGCSASDTINITWDNCTGIEPALQPFSIEISPNPADGAFLIRILGMDGGNWQLITTGGQMVIRGRILSNDHVETIENKGLYPGIYFLRIENYGKSIIRKVVIL